MWLHYFVYPHKLFRHQVVHIAVKFFSLTSLSVKTISACCSKWAAFTVINSGSPQPAAARITFTNMLIYIFHFTSPQPFSFGEGLGQLLFLTYFINFRFYLLLNQSPFSGRRALIQSLNTQISFNRYRN